MEKFLFRAQGLFYLLTGIWPWLSMSSFLAVTGPKTDLWLVKTVGGLAASSGLGFLRESTRAVPAAKSGLSWVALAQALTFALVDYWYVAKGTISAVYLSDAVAETLFVTGWIYCLRKSNR